VRHDASPVLSLERVTFATELRQFNANGIRKATRDDYAAALGVTLDGKATGGGAVAFFGRMQLAAIEPRDLKDYARHVAARGVSANTVRLALAPVKALLATAHDDGLIRANPAAGLRLALGRNAEHEEVPVKALTEEELDKLLNALPAEWRLLFDFLAATGLRIGEAIALRWQDIDLSRRRVHVRRRFYRGTFASPKSKYGRRDVPLTSRLAQELELRWMLEDNVEGLVFPSLRGTVLDSANVMRRVLKPAALTAGVPWAGFHTFRHTAATMLFRRGLNAKQVQLWLGHHSAAFTLDTYVHLLPDDLPDADVLDQLAKRGTEPASLPMDAATMTKERRLA
jgi:integrase